MKRVLWAALLLAVSGCDPGGQTTEPAVRGQVEAEVELARRMPAEAVALVGATFAPDGKLYVLDSHSGLYEVGEKSATLVWNTTGLTGLEFTDVVALGSGRFAVTAENDGFLLDLPTQSLTSYFCYLPPITEQPGVEPMSVSQTLALQGIPVKQRTESVAFNADSLQLFAQPQTIRLDDGAVAGSELFVFGEAGGEPIQVTPLFEDSFLAGGMLALSGGRLLLGERNTIWETGNGAYWPLVALDSAVDITGMARGQNNEVWVLDGPGRRLLKVGGQL